MKIRLPAGSKAMLASTSAGVVRRIVEAPVSGSMREAGAHALVPFALNLLADFELETTKDRAKAMELLSESAKIARRTQSWRALQAAEEQLAKIDEKNARKHAQRAREAAEKYGKFQ